MWDNMQETIHCSNLIYAYAAYHVTKCIAFESLVTLFYFFKSKGFHVFRKEIAFLFNTSVSLHSYLIFQV